MANGYNAGRHTEIRKRMIESYEQERLHKLPAWARSMIERMLNEIEKQEVRREKAELLFLVERLRDTIRFHAHIYYNLDHNLISDYQYDQLYNNLKHLERMHPELVTPDSPTQLVGITVSAPLSGTHRLRDHK